MCNFFKFSMFIYPLFTIIRRKRQLGSDQEKYSWTTPVNMYRKEGPETGSMNKCILTYV